MNRVSGELPEGWKRETGPDGTVRITPRARASRSSGLMVAAAGLACCLLAALLFGTLSRGLGGWRALRLTLLLPLGLLLIGYGLWLAFGREEWRVGADLLEVRQVLFGLRTVRRCRGASLRLVNSGSSASPRTRRLYRAARGGGGASRAAGNWWGLFVIDEGGRRCLYSTSRESARPEAVRALGEFLSERTGWALSVPGRGKKR
jgi:hypothetical protein